MIDGKKVRELREAQGLSLAQLTEQVWKHGGSLTRQRIAQIEQGGQDAKLSKATALAHALGVKVDEIISEQVGV